MKVRSLIIHLSCFLRLVFQIIFVSLFFITAAQADHRIDHLHGSIKNALARYKLPEDSLSLYIKEIGSASPILALNIDTPRNPASVIKVLTTYAGLQMLGPNYTWETHFHLDGSLQNETLNGNLVIEGGGDPLLVTESFWHILYTLRNRGLRHINGDLLIDDELFEDETGSPGDFDNSPYRAYNAFPDAALINFRAHRFHFIPINNKVHIYVDPPTANLQIRNRMRLTNGRCNGKNHQINFNTSTQGSQTIVEFNGSYADKCGNQDLLRAIMPNDEYIFGVFKSLWQDLGGTISGSVGKISYHAKYPFYRVESKPLSEIIKHINKFSNNIMARQLLLTIGQEILGSQGTKTSGRKAIANWLHAIGIPANELILENGSGLSRNTRISARTLGMLLDHANTSPYQPEFFASLPLVGMEGTVKKRLKGYIPPGNARIKTGLIRNVRSMAGYVKSRNNKEYIVVSLQNHPGVQNTIGTMVQDEVLKWLYEQ